MEKSVTYNYAGFVSVSRSATESDTMTHFVNSSAQPEVTGVGVNTSYVRIFMSNWYINQHHFVTSSGRFPVPVRSAVKSILTVWCN